MLNLSRPLRISFIIIGLIVLLSSAFFVGYIIKRSNFSVPFISDKKDASNVSKDKYLVVSDTGDVKTSKEFLKVADKVTTQELEVAGSDLAKSSGIQTTAEKAEFDKKILKDREPVNHYVMYENDKFSTQGIFVFQGDYVTIYNKHSRAIPVVREIKDEKIEFTIQANDKGTIGFDILGKYYYLIDGRQFIVEVKSAE